MLEADLEMASLASTTIRKGQNLLAPRNRTSRLLLLSRVTIPGLAVPLQQHLLALLAVVASGLYGGGAYLANNHFPAVVIGFGTIM